MPTDMASNNRPKLDRRHSTVDLMKPLGRDGGLDARKQVAQELGQNGDTRAPPP